MRPSKGSNDFDHDEPTGKYWLIKAQSTEELDAQVSMALDAGWELVPGGFYTSKEEIRAEMYPGKVERIIYVREMTRE